MREYISIVENALMEYPIAKGAEASFQSWFAGSKVVDKDGKPLVCYHGTFEDFVTFSHATERRASHGFNRLGFWFDVDPRTPSYFAGYDEKRPESNIGSGGGNVMPCYLSIKKPYAIHSEVFWDWDREEVIKLNKELREINSRKNPREYELKVREIKQLNDKLLQRERIDGWSRLMELLPNGVKSSTQEVVNFQKELISEGYDGIFLGETIADYGTRDNRSTDWWIAFRPNQIKSVFAKEFTSDHAILEARRSSATNSKPTIVEQLQKYASMPDVYVSYTSDVGVDSHQEKLQTAAPGGLQARGIHHNAKGVKFGINPKSEFNTPLGIYGFPLDYVLTRGPKFVPFVSERPYLNVFQSVGKVLNLQKYTDEDYRDDLGKLQDMYSATLLSLRPAIHFSDIVNGAPLYAKVNTPAGKIWFVTKIIFERLTNTGDATPRNEKKTVHWSKIFRQLGYSGVVDNGDGIIHENEPTQAVFFSIQAIRPLEAIYNREDYNEWKDKHELWQAKPKTLLDAVKKGRETQGTLIQFIKDGYLSILRIGFENLPKETQDFIKAHPEDFPGPRPGNKY